jgi:hypothetical protein
MSNPAIECRPRDMLEEESVLCMYAILQCEECGERTKYTDYDLMKYAKCARGIDRTALDRLIANGQEEIR